MKIRNGLRDTGLNRRSFVKSSVVVASLLPSFNILAREFQTIGPADDQVNVAIVGYGRAGEMLTDSSLKIPGVQIKAICDIWGYRRKMGKARLKYFKHFVNIYEDYQDMLNTEGNKIDCVIVATPDWMHREITCACLEAGKHVYSESSMANSLKDAREMVLCQRRTGMLLQIGLQRRSNPRYVHAIENVIKKHNVLGEVTHGYAQWNRSVRPFLRVHERVRLATETLEKHGYETMEHFLNWRWFPKYGGGPFADLAPHQLDLFMWAWDCLPCSVMAVGGNEYFQRQVNDNVMATYEFKTKEGKTKRAFQQVLSTSSRGGYYEQFMGVGGWMNISEISDRGNTVGMEICRDGGLIRKWSAYYSKGLFAGKLSIGCTCRGSLPEHILSADLVKPPHMPHLENFFSGVRHGTPLSCPAEVGYRAAVAALSVNRAIKERRTIDFKPEDFDVS